MSNDILYLTEADVTSLVDLNDAIEALEDACARQGRGETLEIAKALGVFDDKSSLHALGSAFPEAGLGGFKTWVNTKRGAEAVMTVFDLENGRICAIIEALALGQLRTAAISGVATRYLAAPDTSEMAILGTGRQAMMQVAAVAAVRPLRRLRVFGRDTGRREAFALAARNSFRFAVEEAESAEAALVGAEVATLVTRAREPFVTADMLAPGMHLNAVGSILPGNSEFTQDVFDRAAVVAVDSLAGAQRNSQEFIDHFGPPGESWNGVRLLSSIVGQGAQSPETGKITLFKAMGMGISDLAVARLALERARTKGVGRVMSAAKPSNPRWRTERLAAE